MLDASLLRSQLNLLAGKGTDVGVQRVWPLSLGAVFFEGGGAK